MKSIWKMGNGDGSDFSHKKNYIWTEATLNNMKYKELEGNITADICVIGAGITGITTAYLLSKQGFKVVLLEKDKVCSRSYSKYNRKSNKSAWTNIYVFS